MRLTAALFIAISTAAGAQDPPRIAKYVPPAPHPAHVFVLDSAHILSDATVAALQDSARALQTETGADVAWVTLPTLGGRPIEEAALYIGRTWRVGSAGNPGDPLRNRGLVVLYVPDRTKTAGPNFRIEVGNGLEGTITDSRSRSITNAMREDLRAKRYDAAYMAGWAVAARLVRENAASNRASATITAPKSVAPQRRASRAVVFVVIVVVAAVAIALIVMLVFVARHQKRGGSVRGSSGARPQRSKPRSRPAVVVAADTNPPSSSDNDDSNKSSGGSYGGGGGFSGGGSSETI